MNLGCVIGTFSAHLENSFPGWSGAACFSPELSFVSRHPFSQVLIYCLEPWSTLLVAGKANSLVVSAATLTLAHIALTA